MILPLLSLSLLAGCTELEPYLPTVTFERLDVQTVDWTSISTDFVFAVNNPNPLEISLASFDYALAFEGVEFLSGEDPDGMSLPAVDDAELPLPVSLDFEALYEMVQAVRGEDTIGFNLAGSIGFDTPIGLVELPYDVSDAFPALRTPDVSLGNLRVKSIDLDAARIALEVNLDNDHATNIFFDNFDYVVKVAGNEVSSGLIGEFAEVEGATTRTADLDMEVDLLAAGTAVYEALTGGNANVKLKASTDVETPFGVVPLTISQGGTVNIE